MASEPIVPRQRTQLDLTLAGKTSSEQVEIVVQELAARLTPTGTAWIRSLADIADRNDLELHVVRRCAAELARLARDRGQQMPGDDDWRKCGDTPNPAAARRALAYAHGHRLRLDLRFAELASATPRWLEAHPNDALIYSLDAFAALGLRAGRAVPALERVASLPDYDGSCRAVCLEGLWFGAHLSDQPARIVALSDEMIERGEDDADLYYWRAFAHRRLHRFDDALTSVDRAIGLLPPSRNGRQDSYAREREMINGSQQLAEQVKGASDQLQARLSQQRYQQAEQFRQHRDELQKQFEQHRDQQAEQARQQREELLAEAEQHAGAARRIVSDSLLGIVNVLALFAILVGYLVALVALAVRAGELWQSLAIVGVMVLGATGLFAVMRSVARVGQLPRRHPPVRRLAQWLGFMEPPDPPDRGGTS